MNLQTFTIKKIPEVDFNHPCSAIISLDSALKKRWKLWIVVSISFESRIQANYCWTRMIWAFIAECKYIEKKVVTHIIDDLESSSDGSDNEE